MPPTPRPSESPPLPPGSNLSSQVISYNYYPHPAEPMNDPDQDVHDQLDSFDFFRRQIEAEHRHNEAQRQAEIERTNALLDQISESFALDVFSNNNTTNAAATSTASSATTTVPDGVTPVERFALTLATMEYPRSNSQRSQILQAIAVYLADPATSPYTRSLLRSVADRFSPSLTEEQHARRLYFQQHFQQLLGRTEQQVVIGGTVDLAVMTKEEVEEKGNISCDICLERWEWMAADQEDDTGMVNVVGQGDGGKTHSCSDPTKLDCGHFFGKACLGEWLKTKRTCPMCRIVVKAKLDSLDGPPRSYHSHGDDDDGDNYDEEDYDEEDYNEEDYDESDFGSETGEHEYGNGNPHNDDHGSEGGGNDQDQQQGSSSQSNDNQDGVGYSRLP